MVVDLDEAGWRTPTAAPGWDVATQVAHLAWTDEVAVAAATDKERWDAYVVEAIADPTGYVDVRALEGGRAAPAELLDRWRVAAPALARTYLVFFDWDKYNLTERAKQIITEAAGAARKTQTTRIEVAGHADRSGTPAYNMGLSRRRADAVAAELVRQGIAKNEIAVSYFGESRPLVPTADGVREPQNRRVEIVLR